MIPGRPQPRPFRSLAVTLTAAALLRPAAVHPAPGHRRPLLAAFARLARAAALRLLPAASSAAALLAVASRAARCLPLHLLHLRGPVTLDPHRPGGACGQAPRAVAEHSPALLHAVLLQLLLRLGPRRLDLWRPVACLRPLLLARAARRHGSRRASSSSSGNSSAVAAAGDTSVAAILPTLRPGAGIAGNATAAAGGGKRGLLRAASGGGSCVLGTRPVRRGPPALLLAVSSNLARAGRAAGLARRVAACSGSTGVLLAPGTRWRRWGSSARTDANTTRAAAAARSCSSKAALPRLLLLLLSPRRSAAAPGALTQPSVVPIGRLLRLAAAARGASSTLLLRPPRLALAYLAACTVAVLLGLLLGLHCCSGIVTATAVGKGASATPTSGAGLVVREPMVG